MDQNLSPSSDRPRSSRWRVVLSSLLGLLTVPVLIVAVTGRWITGTVLDTDNISSRAEVILAEPAVVSAMGDFLGGELMSLYEDNTDVISSLPPALQEKGRIIEAALEAELKTQATTLVGSGAVQELLSQLITSFHSQMVAVIDDAGTTTEPVTLNLVPVATELMRGLQDKGLLPGDLEIPVIDPTLEPADQVAALSTALKVDLPDEMGSVEVFSAEEVASESKELADARRAVSTVRTIAWGSLVLSLLLLVGIWFLSGSRRAGAILVGVVGCIAGIAGLVTSSIVPTLVTDSIEDVLAKEAVSVTITELGSGLRLTNVFLLVVGLLTIALGIWGSSLSARIDSMRRRKAEA